MLYYSLKDYQEEIHIIKNSGTFIKNRSENVIKEIKNNKGKGICYIYSCRKKGIFRNKSHYKIYSDRLLSNILLPAFDYNAVFYPVFICLSRKPGKNRFRILQFIINYRDSFIRANVPKYFTKEMSLKSNLINMRTSSLNFIKKQDLITKGKKLTRRKAVMKHLLHHRTVNEILNKGDYRNNYKEAEDIFNNMISDYSVNFIQIFNKILSPLFSYLYDDIIINKKVIEQMRDIASEYPIILIPNHKSHMDYLLLSYCLFKNDMLCPLIAAGDNLNYFPLGILFRRSGAFFIKRDFKDSLLYPQLFRQYLNFILSSKFSIEFFIEGTRTRTGKLLSPKTGLLRLIIQGAKELKLKDLYIVPVSLEYDRVIEDSVLIDEDMGAPKKKEDLEGLFDIHNFIKKHYNNVYVKLSEPISIKGFLKNHLKVHDNRYTKRRFNALSDHIMENIFNNMEISGSTLLSSVLFFEKRWVTRSILNWRLNKIISILSIFRSYKFFEKFKSIDDFLNDYLSFFEDQEFIIRSFGNNNILYKVKSKKSNQIMRYYFNSISNILLPVSFLSFLIKKQNFQSNYHDELKESFNTILNIFRFEFQPVDIAYIKDKTLDYFLNDYQKLDEITQKRTIAYFSQMCRHVRLSYFYAMDFSIKLLLKNGLMIQNDLIKKIITLSNYYHKIGVIKDFNIISVDIFKNIMDFLIEENTLIIEKNTDKKEDRTLRLNTDNMENTQTIKNALIYKHEAEDSLWIQIDEIQG